MITRFYSREHYPDLTWRQLSSIIMQDWEDMPDSVGSWVQYMFFEDFSVYAVDDIVYYFLRESKSWRGGVANDVKAELRRRAKIKKGRHD